MQCAPADPEFARRGGNVVAGRGQGLEDEFPLGFVEVERIQLVASAPGGKAAGRGNAGGLPNRAGQIAQIDAISAGHDHAMFDRSAQLAHVTGPIIGEERVHGFGSELEERFIVHFAEVTKKAPYQQRDILSTTCLALHTSIPSWR